MVDISDQGYWARIRLVDVIGQCCCALIVLRFAWLIRALLHTYVRRGLGWSEWAPFFFPDDLMVEFVDLLLVPLETGGIYHSNKIVFYGQGEDSLHRFS